MTGQERIDAAVKKIDEMTDAIAREQRKPFTGYAGSSRDALNEIRKVLLS